jgi:hypothetical protein
VPVNTGTASVPAGCDQAALTSIVLGVAACGAGTLTSSRDPRAASPSGAAVAAESRHRDLGADPPPRVALSWSTLVPDVKLDPVLVEPGPG